MPVFPSPCPIYMRSLTWNPQKVKIIKQLSILVQEVGTRTMIKYGRKVSLRAGGGRIWVDDSQAKSFKGSNVSLSRCVFHWGNHAGTWVNIWRRDCSFCKIVMNWQALEPVRQTYTFPSKTSSVPSLLPHLYLLVELKHHFQAPPMPWAPSAPTFLLHFSRALTSSSCCTFAFRLVYSCL